MNAKCGVSVPVPSDHHLLRLVRDDPDYVWWSSEQNRYLLRVPGFALQFDPDLSTSWAEHLLDLHGRSPEDLVSPKRELAFRARVGELQGLEGLTITHSPEGEEPDGCGHVSVLRPEGLPKGLRNSLSTDIALRMHQVAGTVRSAPPGAD